MGILLGTHASGFILVGIIESRLLDNRAAIFQGFYLTLRFVKDGTLQKTKGVYVFNFCTRPKFCLAFWPYGDVGITTKRAFLHIAIADAQPDNQAMEGSGIRRCLRR